MEDQTVTHFYPELGASAPPSTLVVGRITAGRSGSRYRVTWTPTAHDAVLAAFARLKLSAGNVEEFETVSGGRKWSATMTPKVYAKLQAAGIAATECLLD